MVWYSIITLCNIIVNQIYDPNHVIRKRFPYKSDIAAHRWDKSCAKNQTQRQMHSSQWRIRMKWSLSFCAAFFLAVRGDVTFVWESVTNHVIWIVYLINVHYVTIRYINQSYRVDEENSYGSTFLHRLAELVTYVEMRYREISEKLLYLIV